MIRCALKANPFLGYNMERIKKELWKTKMEPMAIELEHWDLDIS